ncbi:MAG: response regulator, partial [Chloroflexota bacterium]
GLSQHGYVVYPAASAQEALDIFKQEEGEFDLVFCDLVLTDGSGLKLAQRLLDLRPDTSVIFTSGYSAEKTDWRVIQEEGYPFLQKPYSLSDLLGVVSEVLG